LLLYIIYADACYLLNHKMTTEPVLTPNHDFNQDSGIDLPAAIGLIDEMTALKSSLIKGDPAAREKALTTSRSLIRALETSGESVIRLAYAEVHILKDSLDMALWLNKNLGYTPRCPPYCCQPFAISLLSGR
jgi:hypothetical protein